MNPKEAYIEELCESYRSVKEEMEALKAKKEGIEDNLDKALGGSGSFTTPAGTKVTVTPAGSAMKFNSRILKSRHPKIYEECRAPAATGRRVTVTFDKEG